MLKSLRLGVVQVYVALAVLLVPVVALAQAAIPESVTRPVSWREALWTAVILPLLGLLYRELQGWLAARRQSAQAEKDVRTRAYVEDLLFRLVDAVGPPVVADLRPVFARAVDPAGPGGAAITGEEWRVIYDAVETELRETLAPDKLDLVMKVIGLPGAARLVAGWVIRRVYATRQTWERDDIETDPAISLYGIQDGPTPEQLATGSSG